MKKYVLLGLLCCAAWTMQGQKLVGSAGKVSSSTAGSVSWSVGELKIATLTGPGGIVTQGFHQPLFIRVGVEAGEPVSLCQDRPLELADLDPSIMVTPSGAPIAATWSTSGTGTFDDTGESTGVYGEATEYEPSEEDMDNGGFTLMLTVDTGGATDDVQIMILEVSCGGFPWDGN